MENMSGVIINNEKNDLTFGEVHLSAVLPRVREEDR